jgi:hypothetical protein
LFSKGVSFYFSTKEDENQRSTNKTEIKKSISTASEKCTKKPEENEGKKQISSIWIKVEMKISRI